MDLIPFIFGACAASFFFTVVGVVFYIQERDRRMRAEAEYTGLASKLDEIELLHAKAEEKIKAQDAGLTNATIYIKQLQSAIAQLQQGPTMGMGVMICGHGPAAAMGQDGKEDRDDDLPSPTGLN